MEELGKSRLSEARKETKRGEYFSLPGVENLLSIKWPK